MLVTRPGAKVLRPFIIGIANIGQAAPAIGLLVLLFLWTAKTGFWIGVLPIALYSLLPVLASTILGLDQVDRSLIDAGRGQGMSRSALLFRVELPLAVPYILAGLRTSLVIAVGTATLSFLVNAGGLGILIDTGYKLQDNVTLILGSVLAVCLALLVDWFGGLAEFFLTPRDFADAAPAGGGHCHDVRADRVGLRTRLGRHGALHGGPRFHQTQPRRWRASRSRSAPRSTPSR